MGIGLGGRGNGGEWRELGTGGGGGGTPPLGDEGFCRAPRLSFLTGVVHMSAELVPGLDAQRDVGRGLWLDGMSMG